MKNLQIPKNTNNNSNDVTHRTFDRFKPVISRRLFLLSIIFSKILISINGKTSIRVLITTARIKRRLSFKFENLKINCVIYMIIIRTIIKVE